MIELASLVLLVVAIDYIPIGYISGSIDAIMEHILESSGG